MICIYQLHSKGKCVTLLGGKICSHLQTPPLMGPAILLPAASFLLYENVMICLYNFANSGDAIVHCLVHMAIHTMYDAIEHKNHVFVI